MAISDRNMQIILVNGMHHYFTVILHHPQRIGSSIAGVIHCVSLCIGTKLIIVDRFARSVTIGYFVPT
jgi:hypothetical protein